VTRAEELAATVRADLEEGAFYGYCGGDAFAALSEFVADAEALAEALEAEVKRVCECDGEDTGSGPGVGVIDCERSSFDYGADSHDGAGNVITDYFDCPCAPLRAALARYRGENPQQAIADALAVVRAEQQRVAALPKTGGIAPDSWGHSWECQTGDGCVCGLTEFRSELARYRGEK
jgi:hypothetical protein